MINPDSKRPVSVEDLLRLKRAERPAAEFWVRFERELRAKQLAAIVEQRPWWRVMPRIFTGGKRYQIPLGASAILAVTFLSVREYRSPASAPQLVPAQASIAYISEPMPATVERPQLLAADFERSAPADLVSVEEPPAATPVVARHATIAPGHLSQMVSWLGGVDEADSPAAAMQSLVAANLATIRENDPEIARQFLVSAGGFESRALPERKQPVDPLAQMKSPQDLKRERYRPDGAFPVATAAKLTGDRVARGLSDDRLNELPISRVKVGGDRFSWKL